MCTRYIYTCQLGIRRAAPVTAPITFDPGFPFDFVTAFCGWRWCVGSRQPLGRQHHTDCGSIVRATTKAEIENFRQSGISRPFARQGFDENRFLIQFLFINAPVEYPNDKDYEVIAERLAGIIRPLMDKLQ